MEAIKIDILNLRVERQKYNNNLVYNELKNGILNEKYINIKEFQRVINELDISKTDLLDKCKNDNIFAKLLSIQISINASRQGNKDELLQLNTINTISSKCGININSLQKYRPTKDGKIISETEYKKNKISKLNCLKTFDAKITGKINGWIFAKVVIGNGGHQDNVFEEAIIFCNWVIKYKEENNYYFVLIDTDLTNKYNELKKKYNNTTPFLIICNHITIQQYFIDNYYE
jgi:hypothetical protein